MKQLLPLLILSYCGMIWGQTVNPGQIRPGSAKDQVFTTKSGVAQPGGPSTAPAVNTIYSASSCTSDIGAQINSIIASMPRNGNEAYGEILLPACNNGVWSTTVTVNSPGISIIGQGGTASLFHCTVAGDCLRIYMSPFTVQKAGIYRGFSILGSGAANQSLIHAGEMVGALFEDIDLANATGKGASCLWLDNNHATTWTERNTFVSMRVANCPALVNFSIESGNPSFAANKFLDLQMNLDGNPGYTGFDLGSGVQYYSAVVQATVNSASAASVVALAGTAQFQGEMRLNGEGSTADLFNTTSGTVLNLTGASDITWVGGAIPHSSISGTAAWFHGPVVNLAFGAGYLATVMPIIYEAGTFQGNSIFTGSASNLVQLRPATNAPAAIEISGTNAANSSRLWSMTQEGDFNGNSASLGLGETTGACATGALCIGGNISLNGDVLIAAATPTISSGFGASPSITTSNGPSAFTITVGSGGTASNGVIGLPMASHGWNCSCTDITTNSATVFICKQTATSTTSATIDNFNNAAGSAPWKAGDTLSVSCLAR
jgi:hypothetical protein